MVSEGLSKGDKGAQQYTLQPYTACAKVPGNTISLAEAATLPDNFVTAFYTLFNQLELPLSSTFPNLTPPPNSDLPILVYGASAVSGQYTVQLLHLAGYKNILATASPRNHDFLKSLGAAHVFDYNSPALEEEVARAIGGEGKVSIVIDSVSSETTLKTIAKLVSPKGKVSIFLPVKEGDRVAVHKSGGGMYTEIPEHKNPLPKGTQLIGVKTFLYQSDEYLKEHLMPEILPRLLQAGLIRPTRVRLMDRGTFLERVQEGLELLRNNKVSGEKVIVKVD